MNVSCLLVILQRSGDQEVDGLRDKVVQLQFQLDKMTESRQELERKIRV